MTGDLGRAMLSALRLGKERAMARKIWLLLVAIVLWTLGQTAWAQENMIPRELREQMYAQVRASAIARAQSSIEANRFLSAEKKAIFLDYQDRLFNQTQIIPSMVDELLDTYGVKLFELPPEQSRAILTGWIGDIFGRYMSAGLTYLSDDDRKVFLSLESDMMSRMEPHYCVLYANGVLTIDSLAQNKDVNADVVKTMSSKQLQAMLDTQLNVFTLGALHKGKPRQVTRAQYDAMTDAFVQELMGWIDSFQPEDLPVVEAYLDGAEISESDYCTLTISLTQMGLEAEGKVGELVRLMMSLGSFDEAEVVSD